MNACFFYQHSNIEERNEWRVNEAIKWIAMIKDASDAYIFANRYLKYSFANFPSIFSSCQCLYIDRFERDIVLNDGWENRGYIMWCPR